MLVRKDPKWRKPHLRGFRLFCLQLYLRWMCRQLPGIYHLPKHRRHLLGLSYLVFLNYRKTSFFERKMNCSLSVLFFLNICEMQTFFAKTKTSRAPNYFPLRFSSYQRLGSWTANLKAFVKRDRTQTMIDLRGIPTECFKNHLCSSIRLSILWAL